MERLPALRARRRRRAVTAGAPQRRGPERSLEGLLVLDVVCRGAARSPDSCVLVPFLEVALSGVLQGLTRDRLLTLRPHADGSIVDSSVEHLLVRVEPTEDGWLAWCVVAGDFDTRH